MEMKKQFVVESTYKIDPRGLWAENAFLLYISSLTAARSGTP